MYDKTREEEQGLELIKRCAQIPLPEALAAVCRKDLFAWKVYDAKTGRIIAVASSLHMIPESIVRAIQANPTLWKLTTMEYNPDQMSLPL